MKCGHGYILLYDTDSDHVDNRTIAHFCEENKFPLDVNKFKHHWTLLDTEPENYYRSIQFNHVILKYVIGGGAQRSKYTPEEEEIFGLSNEHDEHIIDKYEEKLNPPIITAKEWFRKEKWEEIKRLNPNLGFFPLFRLLNKQWDELEDKTKYIELEKKDEIRFKTNFRN